MQDVTTELVKLLPSILWFLLTIVFLVLFYKPIRHELLPRLSGVNVMGVEFKFVEASIDAAIELAQKSPQWKVDVSPKQKQHALNRAKQHLPLFKGTHLLWVDDHPENNVNERRMFAQLGMQIEIARNTEEALAAIGNARYDLLISDMERGADAMAGLDLLNALGQGGQHAPMILYIGVMDASKGIPPGAFGVTNRPDELLHLVLDILERSGY